MVIKKLSKSCQKVFEKLSKSCQKVVKKLSKCQVVEQSFQVVKEVLSSFLGRNVSEKQVIFLSFNHRDTKKLKVGTWFVVKCLYLIYIKKIFNKTQIMAEIRKTLIWNIEHMRKIGSLDEMKILKDLMN